VSWEEGGYLYCDSCDHDHNLSGLNFCPMCGAALAPPEPEQQRIAFEFDPPQVPMSSTEMVAPMNTALKEFLPALAASLNNNSMLYDFLSRPSRRTWEQKAWPFTLEGESEAELEQGAYFSLPLHIARNNSYFTTPPASL
jgi:hypothetical protein